MKCIKNNNTQEISRVSDAIATAKVEAGTHTFVGKQAWKTEVRDVAKVAAPKVEEVPAEQVAEKPKKSKKKA